MYRLPSGSKVFMEGLAAFPIQPPLQTKFEKTWGWLLGRPDYDRRFAKWSRLEDDYYKNIETVLGWLESTDWIEYATVNFGFTDADDIIIMLFWDLGGERVGYRYLINSYCFAMNAEHDMNSISLLLKFLGPRVEK